MLPRIDLLRPAILLAVLWGIALVLFRGWPGIDLAVSGLFWRSGAGFWVLANPIWEFLRNAVWNAEILLFVVALIAAAAGIVLKREILRIPGRVWGFIWGLNVLGPILIVNLFFKNHSGRARPADVTEFGGLHHFSPAGTFTDQCLRNCSFPSGEVSSVVAFALGLWLIAACGRGFSAGFRQFLRGAGVVLTVFIFAQRVIDGRHFLSDASFATLIVLSLGLGLYGLLSRCGPARGEGRG